MISWLVLNVELSQCVMPTDGCMQILTTTTSSLMRKALHFVLYQAVIPDKKLIDWQSEEYEHRPEVCVNMTTGQDSRCTQQGGVWVMLEMVRRMEKV